MFGVWKQMKCILVESFLVSFLLSDCCSHDRPCLGMMLSHIIQPSPRLEPQTSGRPVLRPTNPKTNFALVAAATVAESSLPKWKVYFRHVWITGSCRIDVWGMKSMLHKDWIALGCQSMLFPLHNPVYNPSVNWPALVILSFITASAIIKKFKQILFKSWDAYTSILGMKRGCNVIFFFNWLMIESSNTLDFSKTTKLIYTAIFLLN